MLGYPLNTRVRGVLAVDVGADLALTLDDTPSKYFPAHIAPPSGSNSTYDGSPRSALSPHTLYWVGAVTQLGACHRVEDLDATVYELLAKPEPVTNGRAVVGYSAPMLPVDQLYPRSAELKAMGDAKAIETVACAVFSERESQRSRGSYRDTFAEAPATHWAALSAVGTYALHFADGSEWKIAEASLAPELPFVTMSVREAA